MTDLTILDAARVLPAAVLIAGATSKLLQLREHSAVVTHILNRRVSRPEFLVAVWALVELGIATCYLFTATVDRAVSAAIIVCFFGLLALLGLRLLRLGQPCMCGLVIGANTQMSLLTRNGVFAAFVLAVEGYRYADLPNPTMSAGLLMLISALAWYVFLYRSCRPAPVVAFPLDEQPVNNRPRRWENEHPIRTQLKEIANASSTVMG